MCSFYTCMLKLLKQTYFDYPIHVLKNPSLIKYRFWFLIKFARHKNDFICWYMSWNFYHKFVFQYKMLKQVLWNFRKDKRIFIKYFYPGFWPRLCLTGQVGRPGGRPHQGPVDRAVDRRAQSCARLAAQWSSRPGGRPTCTACARLGLALGRSTGPESSALCF